MWRGKAKIIEEGRKGEACGSTSLVEKVEKGIPPSATAFKTWIGLGPGLE